MVAPLISVIIPAYQSQETLSYCLRSVLNQEFSDFEIIIVNNGSTDRTSEIIDEYIRLDERIKSLYLPINRGPAGGRNAGIRIAKGKYIAFTDSDDEWFPQKLQIQLSFLKSNPKIDFLFSDANVLINGEFSNKFTLSFNAKACINLYSISEKFYELINPRVSVLLEIPICLSSVICRSDVLERVNGFDETLSVTDDLDLWLRIAKDHRLFFLDQVLLNRYRVPSGATSQRNVYNNKLLSYYKKIYGNKEYSDLHNSISKVMKHLYKEEILFQMKKWHIVEAIKVFGESRQYTQNGLLFYAFCSLFGPIPILLKRKVINRLFPQNNS